MKTHGGDDKTDQGKKAEWTRTTVGGSVNCWLLITKAWLYSAWEDTARRWHNVGRYEMKKDEERRMEVRQQKLVSRLGRSAEGGTGLLHKITKPTARRGGVQILKKEKEDAKPLAKCEEKVKDWAGHWQCDTKVPDLQDKPWRNAVLNNLEGDMPRLLEKELEKAAKSYKAKTEE